MPEEVKPAASLTALTAIAQKQDFLPYLQSVLLQAKTEQPRMIRNSSFTIPDEGIQFSENAGKLREVASYVKDRIAGALNGKVPGVTVGFGEDCADALWIPELTAADVNEFEITDQKKNEDGSSVTGDAYTFTLRFADAAAPVAAHSPIARNFRLRDETETQQMIGDALDGFCAVEQLGAVYEGCELQGVVNRLNDTISEMTYLKRTKITADVRLLGVLANMGTVRIGFVLEERTKFGFTWPSMRMSKAELAMPRGDTENLLAYASWDGNNTIQWSSSDEAVVTVDEEGYIKSHAFGEAVITASTAFQGKNYSTQCTVRVKNDVEKLTVSKRKLELKPGEAATLSAKVGPRNATIQTVSWHSENEVLATVSKDGSVQALKAGTVVIYALSDDGKFRSSCTVIISE